MRPSEVRERILNDHVRLRGTLLSLEHLATQVQSGERALLGVGAQVGHHPQGVLDGLWEEHTGTLGGDPPG